MSIKEGKNLEGINLMRGIAAFGVICIHGGLVVDGQVTSAVRQVQTFFNFVVPFFLMAAFYFAIRSERRTPLPWKIWFEKRASRLLIPYVTWSGIYLLLRIFKFALTNHKDRIISLLQDPVGLALFNGGSSIALYFVPLLLIGLVTTRLIGRWLRSLPTWSLCLAVGVAFGALIILLKSGNAYDLGSAQAFNTLFPTLGKIIPFRLLLVFLSDCITCLPFILVAELAVRHLPPLASRRVRMLLLWSLVFAVLSWQGMLNIPVISHLRGIAAFFLSWYASDFISSSFLAELVGTYSFGVYLVHQAFLQLVEVFGRKLHYVTLPMGVGELLIITSSIYVASLALLSLANLSCPQLRRSLGVR